MLSELVRFQTDRGLDKHDYVDINEHGNIIEELLESIGFDVDKADRPRLKEAWHEFITKIALHNDIAVRSEEPLSEHDKVDAYCDIITFSVGALLKLGYDPEKAIAQCAIEINSRVGKMVDGKFEKDITPEAALAWRKADYTLAKL
jgi:predicted HAD superfamily Cof-like phosphohydrolase